MKIKTSVGLINKRCSECGANLSGKTFAEVKPNGRGEKGKWSLCAKCFLNIDDRFEDSEGYDVVSRALHEEL